jgi:hypothetical protein
MVRKFVRCFTKHPAVVGLVLCIAVFIGMGVFAVYQSGKNKEAIRTTCILVSNLTVQGISANEAGTIVRDYTLSNAPESVLKAYREARKRQQPFQTPDCETITNNPSSVHAAPERIVQKVPDKNVKR